MSETSWQERRDFEEGLDELKTLTPESVRRLIEDADTGERSEAILEALKVALKEQCGLLVIDATTDDDDGEVRIEIVMGAFQV